MKTLFLILGFNSLSLFATQPWWLALTVLATSVSLYVAWPNADEDDDDAEELEEAA